MAEEREHAKLGGSGAHRWSQCPGSVSLVVTLPPEKQSEAASEGTRKHDLCEQHLRAFLQYKIDGVKTDLPAIHNYEDQELVEGYVQYIWEQVLESALTGKAWGMEDCFYIDKSLGMFGYVDFWAAYIDDKGRRHGKVVDLKTGFHYVPATKNYQMAFYADGLRCFLRENGKDLDVVDCCIYQPKTEWEPYRCASHTSKQLDVYHKRFMDAAHDIYVSKKAKFKCGDWCEYCPALGVCPKYGRELEKKASLKIIDASTAVLPTPDQLTEQQLKNVVLHGTEIEVFVRACRAHVINLHANSRPVSGLKVVEGTSRRKWLDDEENVAGTLVSLGFDPWRRKLCTLTEAERKLGKDSVKSLTTFTKASPVIVPEDDTREAISSLLDKTDE